LQQALDLLDPSTSMAAVTVEGIRSEAVDSDQRVWDGVDCALYFGGKSLETATKVVIAQLKYSTTEPEDDWTVARLTYNKRKRGDNSVLRRLADAFTAATSRMEANSELVVRLVSNQGVASEVFEVVEAVLNGVPCSADAKLTANIAKIETSTGLSGDSLISFLKHLNLSEDGTASRHSLRGAITKHVAEIVGEDEGATVRELMNSIRDLMMPEKAREFISRETIVGWFGVSSDTGLFPAPSDFKAVTKPIEREPARALLAEVQKGTKVICLHGSAGCGKTTTLMQLSERIAVPWCS
jgi:SpoVK/Ycf46/Vps4 family AAA+-type ATPase